MTRKRSYATKPRSRWDRVRAWRNCANGHEVRVGTVIRWTLRWDRTFVCADCLAKQGIFPPGDMREQGQADV